MALITFEVLKKIVGFIVSLPLFILSFIPLGVLYLISQVLYFILYYIIGYRKRVVKMNFNAAFPDTSSKELFTWQKEFYKYLSRLIMEIIKSFTCPPSWIKERMSVENNILEKIEEYRIENRNIIILTGHYGNWEWAAIRLSAIKGYKKYIIYREQSSGIIDFWMKQLRKKGDSILLAENHIRQIIEPASVQPTMLIMAADQSPVNTTHSIWVNFLGINTPFHPGPERIAGWMDAVVLYAAVKPVKKGKYHIEISELTDSPVHLEKERLTKLYAQSLEKDIVSSPEFWLWSHRRWKRAGIPGLN